MDFQGRGICKGKPFQLSIQIKCTEIKQYKKKQRMAAYVPYVSFFLYPTFCVKPTGGCFPALFSKNQILKTFPLRQFQKIVPAEHGCLRELPIVRPA